jgi:hypothetical protein
MSAEDRAVLAVAIPRAAVGRSRQVRVAWPVLPVAWDLLGMLALALVARSRLREELRGAAVCPAWEETLAVVE